MNNIEKRTGLWIPIEYIENKELDWTNKALLTEICSLHELPKGCFASNENFGKLLGITSASASKRITKLTSLGYIKTENIHKKGMCIGRFIIPSDKSTNTNKIKRMPEQQKSSSQVNKEAVTEQSKSSSSVNQGVVLEPPGGSSSLTLEVLPEHPESGSSTTRGVVLEQPGGSSQENTNNTSINSEIFEQIPVQEEIIKQVLVQDAGGNSDITISDNHLNEVISPLQEMRGAMNEWFEDYPTWENDLYTLGLEKFIWKTSTKYGTADQLSIDIIKYFLTL